MTDVAYRSACELLDPLRRKEIPSRRLFNPYPEGLTRIAFPRTLAAECGGSEPPPEPGAPQSASMTEPG